MKINFQSILSAIVKAYTAVQNTINSPTGQALTPLILAEIQMQAPKIAPNITASLTDVQAIASVFNATYQATPANIQTEVTNYLTKLKAS